MKISDIDFRGGDVQIRSDINTDLDLETQIWALKEDIAAVSYKFGFFLDIGWLPEFRTPGAFRVTIGKDSWEDIRYEIDVPLESLMPTIKLAVSKVQQLITEEKKDSR